MFITDKNIYEFQHGDVVNFNIDNIITGTGKIVGQSHTSQVGLGRGYIVESVDGKFPNDSYPFTHLVVFESLIVNHPNKELENAIH